MAGSLEFINPFGNGQNGFVVKVAPGDYGELHLN